MTTTIRAADPPIEGPVSDFGAAFALALTSNSPGSCRDRSLAAEQARHIEEITRRLFPPGALSVAAECDPEDPANQYLAIDVQATGDFASTAQRQRQWHDEVAQLVPGDSTWLRLCVYPR